MSSLWSVSLHAPVRGLSLAREAELLLARTENSTLWLLNGQGDPQGSIALAGASASCIADDGSALAAAGVTGQVWWLARDLTMRWERRLATGALTAAVDSFGHYLAIAEKGGGLSLFSQFGDLLGQFQSPRPIHHLAFVPASTQLVAAADFGWCGCLELTTGEWAWSDRPVSHIGSLAVAAAGEPLLLACFTEGLRRYGVGGAPEVAIQLPAPCGQVALSFAGDVGAAAGTGRHVFAFDHKGEMTFSLDLDHAPAALALSGLGDRLAYSFANGTVKMMQLTAP
jgi:hypothetical protein